MVWFQYVCHHSYKQYGTGCCSNASKVFPSYKALLWSNNCSILGSPSAKVWRSARGAQALCPRGAVAHRSHAVFLA